MSIEEKIKSVWPSGLGTCRFGKAEHIDEKPYTIINLISSSELHKDDGEQLRYQADVYLSKIDTELIRTSMKTFTHADFTVIIEDKKYSYIEDLKCYLHMVEFVINVTWPQT